MRSDVGAFWNGSRLELRRWLDFFFLLPAADVDDLWVELELDGTADDFVACVAPAGTGTVAANRIPNSPVMANLRIFELGSSLHAFSRLFAITFAEWLATADPIMGIFGLASSGDLEFGAYRAPVRKAVRLGCRLRLSLILLRPSAATAASRRTPHGFGLPSGRLSSQSVYCAAGTAPARNRVRTRSPSPRRATLNRTSWPGLSLAISFL
jgi:hypothetical protein